MVLSAETIRSYLAQSSLADEYGLDVIVLGEIDSTNNWALQQCKQGRALPFVCLAEKQTSGRGRRGKVWLQSQNANIAMSVVLPCTFARETISHLPLAIGLSIVYALEEMGVKKCQLKWPNDVLVAGEKIAGILIETVSLATSDKRESGNSDESKAADWAAIIGIGFNYDMSDIDKEALLNVAWTDLISIFNSNNAGKVASADCVLQRNEVTAILLKNCLDICSAYPDNVPALRSNFESKYDYCQGKPVELLLDDGKSFAGLAMGLSDNAELMVNIEGVEQVFHSADVSVRPVVKK